MREDAAKQILNLLKQIEYKKEERVQCFMRQQVLDKEIADLEKTLNVFGGAYEVVYEKDKPKEFVQGQAPVIVESNGTVHI